MRRLVLVVLLPAIVGSAHADWPAGGKVVVAPNTINGVRSVSIMDHPSGDLTVIGLGNGGNGNGPVVGRVRRSGEIDPAWPALGTPLTWALKSFTPSLQGYAIDDSGNVWHSTYSSAVRLELVTPGGIHDPAVYWTPSTSSGPCRMHVAAGAAGDVFSLTSGTRLQHTYRTGVRGAGWPTSGMPLPIQGFFGTTVCADGHSGAIVFGFKDPRPVAIRVDSSGSVHSGWDPAGLILSDDLNGDYVSDRNSVYLLPSGADHVLAIWLTAPFDPIGNTDPARFALAQRFSVDGTLDPAWAPGGNQVTPLDTLADFTALADGGGGAYLLWNSSIGPRGMHILADGSAPAGIDPNGVSLVDAAAMYVRPQAFLNVGIDDMVAAVRPGGGLMFAWGDQRLAPLVTYRLRWLQSNLSADPDKPDTGAVVVPASEQPGLRGLRAIHSDGQDGAYMAWEDAALDQYYQAHSEVWMTRVLAPEFVGVAPPVAGRAKLALSAPRPNPARGAVALDVTLPDDSPAAIELLDVAGRVVLTQHVAGAGPHTVGLAGGSLAPGLYFVRLSHRAGTRTTRAVLSR